MYTNEQLLNIYSTAYFNEAGLKLTQEALNKIVFDRYLVTYDSFTDRLIIELLEFDDKDTFPYPDTVRLMSEGRKGWRIL